MFRGEGKNLFSRSIRVLACNRKLLAFPIAALVGLILLTVLFFGSVPTGHDWTTFRHWAFLAKHHLRSPKGGVALSFWVSPRFLAVYLSSTVFATLCNVALYREISQALKGEPVSIAGGSAFAVRRIRAILAWSIFSTTIGLAISAVDHTLGLLSRLGITATGAAWSVASVFVMPVMIRDGSINPFHLMKVSTSLVRRTWGETVYGFIGIGSRYVLWIALAIFLGLRAISIFRRLPSPAVALFATFAIFMYALVTRTLVDIYQGALYVYATEGVVPLDFKQEDMDGPWKVR